MKKIRVEDSELWRILKSLLSEYGFEARPSELQFVRASGGVHFVIGLRASRHSKKEYAIYFAPWLPEFEEMEITGNALKASNFLIFNELSPEAPLKNTYWWGLDELDEALISALQRQVHGLVLPYFSTFASVWDVIEALAYRSDAAAEKVARRLRITYAGSYRFPEFLIGDVEPRVQEQLAFLKAEEGFALDEGRFWRNRSGVVDLVVPEYLASGRFVCVYAAVWHSVLEFGESDVLPGEMSLATARDLSPDGVGVGGMDSLWFVGTGAPMPALAQVVRTYGLEFFKGIEDRNGVLAAILPQYRSYIAPDRLSRPPN